jgi:hypothetical protein
MANRHHAPSGTIPGYGPQAVVGLALKEPELSPRELAIAFADRPKYFVTESNTRRAELLAACRAPRFLLFN